MLTIIKWTAVANIDAEGTVLHRELDFLKEEEIDAFIAGTSDPYEKIPVWAESYDTAVPFEPTPPPNYN